MLEWSTSISYLLSSLKELHAHLNGSISAKTMQTLIERKREKAVVSGVVPQHWETTIAKGEQRTMEEYVACDYCVTCV